MPIRLIALDLDGTLVNSRWEISEKDLQAVTAASEREVQIVVVTGRRPRAAAPYVAKLPFPVTLITSNGAMIRTPAGEVIYQDFLPREVALKVLEIVNEYRPYTAVIFDLPGRGQVTMQDCAIPEGPLGWYLRTSMDHLLLVPDLNAAVNSDPVQVMIGGPPERIEASEAMIHKSEAGSCVNVTWTKYPQRNIAIFDIMNRECSKGKALKFWAARCGIPASEVMAFGDNFNDRDMLEFAGLPVVMGNHIEGLHRPHWALTSACDDSGVACAIERFVLKA
jgi:Cof subfamily protein (haloacid dehalogenase superfamily)